jgi:hypothetical protein
MEGVAEELICGTRGAMGRREALARLGHAGLRWATVALYWAVEGAEGVFCITYSRQATAGLGSCCISSTRFVSVAAAPEERDACLMPGGAPR